MKPHNYKSIMEVLRRIQEQLDRIENNQGILAEKQGIDLKEEREKHLISIFG